MDVGANPRMVCEHLSGILPMEKQACCMLTLCVPLGHVTVVTRDV